MIIKVLLDLRDISPEGFISMGYILMIVIMVLAFVFAFNEDDDLEDDSDGLE